MVDDNATNRRILEEVLQNWGLKPDCRRQWRGGFGRPRERVRRRNTLRARAARLSDAEMDGFIWPSRFVPIRGCRRCPLVLLSSSSQIDEKRCEQLGFPFALASPSSSPNCLRHLRVLGEACRKCRPRRRGKRCAIGTVDGPQQESTSGPLTILLAEDNDVNQRVARGNT